MGKRRENKKIREEKIREDRRREEKIREEAMREEKIDDDGRGEESNEGMRRNCSPSPLSRSHRRCRHLSAPAHLTPSPSHSHPLTAITPAHLTFTLPPSHSHPCSSHPLTLSLSPPLTSHSHPLSSPLTSRSHSQSHPSHLFLEHLHVVPPLLQLSRHLQLQATGRLLQVGVHPGQLLHLRGGEVRDSVSTDQEGV